MAKYQTPSNNIFVNSPVNTQSGTSYTAALTDYIIEVNSPTAAFALTLPAPSTTGALANKGKVYIVKDVGGAAFTHNITITPASGTIDGGASISIAANYGSVQVFTDGTEWYSASINNSSNTPTINLKKFTATGTVTYTPSANLQYAIVEVIGGGGGGGGAGNTGGNQISGAAGGGAGGYARAYFPASQLIAAAPISVTINTGGTGGAAGASGTAGGTVSFSSGANLVQATGGALGTGGSATQSLNTVGSAGGVGSLGGSVSGIISDGGAGQGSTGLYVGSTGSSPAINIGFGGAGGNSFLGGGGQATFGVQAGFAGTSFGAGGSGGCVINGGTTGVAGGAGETGAVFVTEYIFAAPPLTTTASITWNTVSLTSATMTASNGYITTNAALTTLTLPATAAVGTQIEVIGSGTGLWKIAQNLGQNIQYGNQSTTVGTGGSLSSEAQGDSIVLVCTVANTTWYVLSSNGNFSGV